MRHSKPIAATALFFFLPLAAQEPTPTPAEPKLTGWVCGVVLDEALGFIADAEVTLTAGPQTGAAAPAVAARLQTDPHGTFCAENLAPGFFQLVAARHPWPPQPPRTVEVRAGQMNRLLPIEMEWEPGEPRISFVESFDGMPASEVRPTLERLLEKADGASIQELARRLLPKRGYRIDIARQARGLDMKPVVDELMRQLERAYLPPLKTARYLYVVGELIDPRTRDAAMWLLLRKLRDARRLPPDPASSAEGGGALYVSDVAMHTLARLAGKDFKWQYGVPPLQNQSAIQGAVAWWQGEVDRRDRDRQRR